MSKPSLDQPAWRDEDDKDIRSDIALHLALTRPLIHVRSVDMMTKIHRKRLRLKEEDRIVSGETYTRRLRNK